MSNIGQWVGQLFEQAVSASEHAHAPYSGARVGACVVDESGNTYTGCNVESASFGLTQCAERNALASAIAAGMSPGSARALLIYAEGFGKLSPCGACRQWISELMAADAVVISCQSKTEYQSWTIVELLPDPFALN